jgi:hypothetical protein
MKIDKKVLLDYINERTFKLVSMSKDSISDDIKCMCTGSLAELGRLCDTFDLEVERK